MSAAFYVNVLSHYRPKDTDGRIGFIVEYMATSGPARSGKVSVELPALRASFWVRGLRAKIREAVAAELGVSPKDIAVMSD